jgi:RHS repeat-associated protein
MKIRLLFFLLPMLGSMVGLSQNITGTSPVDVGSTHTYTFSDGALYMNYGWQISGTGTVVSSSSSGTSYYVTMSWPACGSTTLYFVDYTAGVVGTLVVTINPGTPTTTFTYVKNCASTDITRTTNPPTGVNWYWQTSSTGTSTSLGFAATINRTTTGMMYLRAQWESTGVWSTSSQQVPAFTIITAPPSVPASSTDGNVISNVAVSVPVSVSTVSGATSYKWFTVSSGGTPEAGQIGNTWSPLLSSTQQYWVEAVNDNCSSTTRKAVTAYVHPEPIITATNNGMLALGNSVELSVGNYSYDTFQWLDGANNNSPISGATASSYIASVEGKFRVRVSKANSSQFSSQTFTVSSAYSQNLNYIISNAILTPNISEASIKTLPVEKVSQTIQYFDDLGRPMQSVSTQGSPNKEDIVQPVAYDVFGREEVKYLPYTASGVGNNSGSFKNSALVDQSTFYTNTSQVATDAAPFAKTIFEPSPLNRVLEQGAPGTSWQPDPASTYLSPIATDHAVKFAYELNGANEVMLFDYINPNTTYPMGFIKVGKTGHYSANQLYKKRTRDEQTNEVIEYADKDGHTILKKVQASATTYAQTYYIYDDVGNLVYVLQPEGVQSILNNLPITWANKLNVTSDPVTNTLTRSSGTGYESTAGATSTVASETLAAGTDGWVEATAIETDKSRMIGLAPSNVVGTAINFALELANDGKVYVWESGVKNNTSIATYVTGTTVRIAREGTAIKYYVDGVLKQTSGATSSGSLIVDTAFNESGATLQYVIISFKVNAALVQSLNNFAFRYTYDYRKRMTQKEVPGADPAYMVYDARDRVVMTQDGNQRSTATKYWTFTKYDELNRPILTGIKDTAVALTQLEMQGVVDTYYSLITTTKPWRKVGEKFIGTAAANNIHGYTNYSYPQVTTTSTLNAGSYLSVTYYDNYTFRSDWLGSYTYVSDALAQTSLTGSYTQPATGSENQRLLGLVTGTKIKVLDGGVTGGTSWLKSINYYDEKYRIMQSINDNYRGGQDRVSMLYDFAGKVLKTKSSHYDVTWKDLVGIARIGDDLKRTVTIGTWGSSGAASVEMLPADKSGWLEFSTPHTNKAFMIGVSTVNANASWTSIGYLLYVMNDGTLQVRENGLATNFLTGTVTYSANDIFRIEIDRTAAKIRYYRNGIVLLERPVIASAFLIDLAAGTASAEVANIRSSFGSFSAKEITRRFEYDHIGRLLKTYHTIGTNAEILLSQNEYNELGQLVDKNLHIVNAVAKQSVDYRYNIRGWLTSINNAQLSSSNNGDTNNDSGDLFGMELSYNTSAGIGNDLLYNGNISAVRWSNGLGLSSVKEKGYVYSYDAMNRLTSSVFKEKSSLWTSGIGKFGEGNLTYDLNGNILSLSRYDHRGRALPMDSLTYNYGSGTTQSNRLLGVTDAGDDNAGFREINSSSDDYIYDANGNMIIDFNKQPGNVAVNESFNSGNTNWVLVTNQPTRITFNNSAVQLVAGTSSVKLEQRDIIKPGLPYQVIVDRTWSSGTGTFTIGIGGANITAAGAGIATYNITSGTTPDLVLTFSTNFAGEVRSIQVIPGTAITSYNYLNLPSTVGQGLNSLKYIYDATGRKLSQEVFGVSDLIKKKSDYAGEYFYENDTLKFIQHEEGRIIPETGGSYTYQYNLKDHLGNVRLTFTTKHEVESSTATMETVNASTESGQYLYYDEAIKISNPLYDHTYNNTTGSTYYATRLTGGNTNAIYGLAKSLSVMPGDTVKAEVFAKYLDYSDSTNWSQGLKNLVKSISQGSAPIGTRVDGGAAGSLGTSTYPFTPISHTSESGTAPMAYLNYVVVNRDYTTVLDQGFMRITTNAKESGQNVAHETLSASIAIQEPGYVYIYLSNENPTIVEVFFDDFKVEHIKSPVIQMDDYYPFGLAFNSYSRENSVKNLYQYNGKEKQDELDLGWLDYGARMYDPLIVRWMTLDPMADLTRRWSPYTYVYDNPVKYIDPDGMLAVQDFDGNWHDLSENDYTNTYRAPNSADQGPTQEKGPGKSYVFYDPRPNSDDEDVDGGFPSQAIKEQKRLEEKYGKGTAELVPITTEKEFVEAWKNMDGKINEVTLIFHGGPQTININWKNQEYLTATGDGLTPGTKDGKATATNIQDLPTPKGDMSNGYLNIYSCRAASHSTHKNVANTFLMSTNFRVVIASPSRVNFILNVPVPKGLGFYRLRDIHRKMRKDDMEK